MPNLKSYKLFISHSWAYSDAYNKFVSILNEQPLFEWVDYSVPKDDPVHDADNQKELYEAIRRQMQFANCVVILAGVYATYSKWINKEIELSKKVFSKPIVAVEPWGAEKTSQVVKDSADIVVKWNGKSIVDAIRQVSI